MPFTPTGSVTAPVQPLLPCSFSMIFLPTTSSSEVSDPRRRHHVRWPVDMIHQTTSGRVKYLCFFKYIIFTVVRAAASSIVLQEVTCIRRCIDLVPIDEQDPERKLPMVDFSYEMEASTLHGPRYTTRIQYLAVNTVQSDMCRSSPSSSSNSESSSNAECSAFQLIHRLRISTMIATICELTNRVEEPVLGYLLDMIDPPLQSGTNLEEALSRPDTRVWSKDLMQIFWTSGLFRC
ncbi:hypothetical protein KCU83_g212, partial [Aureobasidium melanogenum]